jgi:two-component system sensor histidine kinase VicK
VDDITFNRFFKEINADITLESLQYLPTEDCVEREIRLNDYVLRLSFVTFSQDSNDGGVIVVIHDITKQERLESARRDFVANVSHELRTPLTVIKSYADILADTPDAEPELRTRFLDTISSETDRMTKIVSDLLTLSKLDENANYSIPSDNIDIRSMIEGLVERLSLTAKKKNQTLTYTPINDVPNIKGDRDGLERVLTNIISNALKYTPTDGKIQIFSSKVYNDILIKISDTGIGISKEQLPNIFDRFFRVDKARSRDKGGTGLGLAIAKETIETTFHGKILINSQLNKGTDVTVSIPIPKKN